MEETKKYDHVICPVKRLVTPDDWREAKTPEFAKPTSNRTHYEALIFNGNYTPKIYTAFAQDPLENLFDILYSKRNEWNFTSSERLGVGRFEEYQGRFPPRPTDLGTMIAPEEADIERVKEFVEQLKAGTYIAHSHH